jgi:hypothetical protein
MRFFKDKEGKQNYSQKSTVGPQSIDKIMNEQKED